MSKRNLCTMCRGVCDDSESFCATCAKWWDFSSDFGNADLKSIGASFAGISSETAEVNSVPAASTDSWLDVLNLQQQQPSSAVPEVSVAQAAQYKTSTTAWQPTTTNSHLKRQPGQTEYQQKNGGYDNWQPASTSGFEQVSNTAKRRKVDDPGAQGEGMSTFPSFKQELPQMNPFDLATPRSSAVDLTPASSIRSAPPALSTSTFPFGMSKRAPPFELTSSKDSTKVGADPSKKGDGKKGLPGKANFDGKKGMGKQKNICGKNKKGGYSYSYDEDYKEHEDYSAAQVLSKFESDYQKVKTQVEERGYQPPEGRFLGRFVEFKAKFGFIRAHPYFHRNKDPATGAPPPYPLPEDTGSKDIFVLLTECTRGLRKFEPFQAETSQEFIARSDRRYLDVNTIDTTQVTEYLARHQEEICVLFSMEQSTRTGVKQKAMAVALEFLWCDPKTSLPLTVQPEPVKVPDDPVPEGKSASAPEAADYEKLHDGYVVTWKKHPTTGGFGYLRCIDLYARLGCDVFVKGATINTTLSEHIYRYASKQHVKGSALSYDPTRMQEVLHLMNVRAMPALWNDSAGKYLEKWRVKAQFKIHQPRRDAKPEAWHVTISE
ncbi:unnamed protein product [Amoebophrya sp. A25]|nr:unnamed protein product [Amoebophrya sp. A25]|eukprot:GSA25T00023661001.1